MLGQFQSNQSKRPKVGNELDIGTHRGWIAVLEQWRRLLSSFISSLQKNIERCQANDAETCEYRMSILQNEQDEILYMDTFALGCRPNACSNTSSWSSAVSSIQTTQGFHWEPRNDSITNSCTENPSQCTFEFNACGGKTQFPFKKSFTNPNLPSKTQDDDDTGDNDTVMMIVIIAGGVASVAAMAFIVFQLRKSNKQPTIVFRQYE